MRFTLTLALSLDRERKELASTGTTLPLERCPSEPAMWGWQSSRTVVISLAVVAFIVCCLLPIGYLVAVSLGNAGVVYAAMVPDARQRVLLYTTTALGTGAAMLATAIGAPLGVALARTTLPQKPLLRLALASPTLLPPYVVALAWIYLGGDGGLVATLAGSDLLSEWTYSLPAAVLVLGLVFYPLSMLATEVAMRRVDRRLEEAALMCAPPRRVIWSITLPLAAPGIFAAALVIFVLAVSEFGVPGLLRVRVYTTEVFTAFAALYDFTRAILLAVPLLLVCMVAALLAGMLLGDRLTVTRRTVGTRQALFDAWRRPALVAGLIVVAVALGLPLATLLREASRARSLASALSGSGQSIANSLLLATLGSTAVLTVAVWIGYARARAGRRWGHFADVLWIVLFGVPSTIVGVGLIGVWNRPGAVGSVYGTHAMFILAYLARLVPVAALALGATMRSIPVSHEEAAAVSGARWLRTMSRIVLPQIRLALVAAWVIVFILAFGELGVSILVAPPGEATLPIRIHTIIANTPSSQVAALALLQTAVIFTPLAALGLAVSLRETR